MSTTLTGVELRPSGTTGGVVYAAFSSIGTATMPPPRSRVLLAIMLVFAKDSRWAIRPS